MNSHEVVRNLCKRAIDALQAGKADLALHLCATAKGQKEPYEGLDVIRALAFTVLQQPYAAYEALKEELRFFPQNTEAQKLLQQMEQEIAKPQPESKDKNFRECCFRMILRDATIAAQVFQLAASFFGNTLKISDKCCLLAVPDKYAFTTRVRISSLAIFMPEV